MNAFTSSSLRFFEKFAEDIRDAKKGNAYIAHFLIPHHPFLYDEKCNIITIKPYTEDYDDYLKQIVCVQNKIDDLISMMKENRIFSDSIVVIHSDHGSRIAAKPSSQEPLIPIDYMIWHSSFFAFHKPDNFNPQYITTPASISELLKRVVLEKEPDKMNENYVYIMPNGDIPHDYRFLKQKMPPFLGGEVVKKW